MLREPRSPATFRHCSLVVESEHSVRQLLVPAVRQALAQSDGVFMAVAAGTARLVRAELGPAADALEWGDTAAFYQRLGFAYEVYRRFLAAAHAAGRRVHVFTQPDLSPDPGQDAGAVDRTVAYLAYEAISNETYADYGCEVTCLWDARQHPAALIESARALHSHQLGAAGVRPTPGYLSPRQYLAGQHRQPLPPPAAVDWQARLATADGLPALRGELRAWAGGHGYAAAAAADVTMAVNEIATNGLSHGRPPVEVRGWHHGDTLVVQVDDHGGAPLPAAGGYEPPRPQQERTRGLWLARQLADVMQTHAGGGTTSVRLHFPYQPTHQRPPYLAS